MEAALAISASHLPTPALGQGGFLLQHQKRTHLFVLPSGGQLSPSTPTSHCCFPLPSPGLGTHSNSHNNCSVEESRFFLVCLGLGCLNRHFAPTSQPTHKAEVSSGRRGKGQKPDGSVWGFPRETTISSMGVGDEGQVCVCLDLSPYQSNATTPQCQL